MILTDLYLKWCTDGDIGKIKSERTLSDTDRQRTICSKNLSIWNQFIQPWSGSAVLFAILASGCHWKKFMYTNKNNAQLLHAMLQAGEMTNAWGTFDQKI